MLRHLAALSCLVVMAVVGWGFALAGLMYAVASLGSSKGPLPIDLATLEAGDGVAEGYVWIHRHFAGYWAATAQHRGSSSSPAVEAEDVIDYTYYPIFAENPLREVRFRSLDPRSPRGREAVLPPFVVVVRTRRFATLEQVPTGLRSEEGVEGMLASDWERPPPALMRNLMERLPGLSPERVILLDEGLRPRYAFFASTFGGSGVVLLAGAGLLVWRFYLGPRGALAKAPDGRIA